MQISFTIENLDDVEKELEDFVPDLVRKVTFGIETGGKLAIQTSPASGNIYPRGKSVFHQASAPGEAPATDTGFLVNSIQSFFESDVVGVVEVGAIYGSILEEKLDRPFMSTAIEKTLNEFF